MRVNFDTNSQPCVPVYRDGLVHELSLRDVLVRAHEFHSIQHELPTVEFGLYRLLVALVGDIFFVEPGQPLNTQRLGALLAQGRFDEVRVDEYFANHPRFDLFDEDKPFLQVGRIQGEEKPLAALLHPIPSGTNVNHFHHAAEDDFAVSPKAAVGLLATAAPWMTSGGQGLTPSINDAPPIYVLVNGSNLFETLCLNLCALHLRYARDGEDAPSWRWKRTVGGPRNSSGYLESLTWMPRRIRLIADSGGKCHLTNKDSDVLIRSMIFIQGDSTKAEGKAEPGQKAKKERLFTWMDSNVGYELTEKGPIPLRMSEGRELWRDVAALALVKGNSRFERPRIIDQFEELSSTGSISRDSPLYVSLYGLRTDSKMKFFEWQRDLLALPRPLVLNSVFGNEVQDWMGYAEKTSNVLVGAVGYLHPKRYRQENKAAHDPKSKVKFRFWEDQYYEKVKYENLKKRIMYAERRYWESLRPVFNSLLSELASLEINTFTQRQPLRIKWRTTLEKAARDSFEVAVKGFDSRSHTLERVVRARGLLTAGLKRVFDPPESKPGKSSKKKGVKAE